MTATTVAAIALKAFTGVAAKISGVIKPCAVARDAPDATYNAATGAYTGGTVVNLIGGECVETTAAAVKDIFPALVIGPSETVFFIRGLSGAPQEDDDLTVTEPNASTTDYKISAVGDVVGAGDLFAVIAT